MLINIISRGGFVDELTKAVSQTRDLVAEHLSDNDELILHLLMSDLLRLTVSNLSRRAT
ncbi:MAG: hypothetical protein H0X12_16880 [Nocardioides sp.]|nr:hypothetical protein [Nocardioides sp.]